MADRYILVDVDGNIVNAILWDGEAVWEADGLTPIQNDEYDIGGTLIDDEYTPPPPPEE